MPTTTDEAASNAYKAFVENVEPELKRVSFALDQKIVSSPHRTKLDEDRYWLSIADSNILFWARAIAAERGLAVAVTEPDVSPMAIQVPDAENVVASIFGDWVRDLRYFWFRDAEVDGIPLKVARSGWSKQGKMRLQS